MAEATQAATKAALEQAAAMNSVLGGQIGFEASIDAVTASLKENGKAHSTTTEKGRANLTALSQLAAATIGYAKDLNDTGASQEEISAVMSRGREKFIDAAKAMGMSSKEAKALADKLGLVPENKDVKVKTDIDKKGINAWESYRPGTKDAYIKTHILPASAQVKIDGATLTVRTKGGRYAEGGLIGGWSPTPTADNHLVAATSGEYMQRVSAVDYYGVGVMDALNTRRIPREVVQGYAGGGLIGGGGAAASAAGGGGGWPSADAIGRAVVGAMVSRGLSVAVIADAVAGINYDAYQGV